MYICYSELIIDIKLVLVLKISCNSRKANVLVCCLHSSIMQSMASAVDIKSWAVISFDGRMYPNVVEKIANDLGRVCSTKGMVCMLHLHMGLLWLPFFVSWWACMTLGVVSIFQLWLTVFSVVWPKLVDFVWNESLCLSVLHLLDTSTQLFSMYILQKIARPEPIVIEQRNNQRLPAAERVNLMMQELKSKMQSPPAFMLCILPERKTSDLYGM